MLAVILMVLAPLAAAGETVKGRVVLDDGPLPGVTVTLAGKEMITDSLGEYVFEGIPRGSYKVELELAGLVPASLWIDINGPTTVEPVTLKMAIVESLPIGCPACDLTAPLSKFDFPLCADQELNDSLIEAMEGGDRSAMRLLRERYRRADSYYEQHRIGAALLGRTDDGAIWNELVADASIALRFPHAAWDVHSDAFLKHCETTGIDANDLWWMSYGALNRISGDPRSRPLLLQALESGDEALIALAIAGLAEQGDTASLPLIERALDRLGPEIMEMAIESLAAFKNEQAEALMKKYDRGDE